MANINNLTCWRGAAEFTNKTNSNGDSTASPDMPEVNVKLSDVIE